MPTLLHQELTDQKDIMTSSQNTLNDKSHKHEKSSSASLIHPDRFNLKLIKTLWNKFKKKEKMPVVDTVYDNAMTCLCMSCPTCKLAMQVMKQYRIDDDVDIPKLHFITKYDTESRKTLVREHRLK